MLQSRKTRPYRCPKMEPYAGHNDAGRWLGALNDDLDAIDSNCDSNVLCRHPEVTMRALDRRPES